LELIAGRCKRGLEIIAQAAHPADWRNRVEFLPL
jgi:hypothetical protein